MAKKYSRENKNKVHQAYSDQHLGELAFAPLPRPVIPAAIVFVILLALVGSMDNTIEKSMGLLSSVIVLILLLTTKKSTALKDYCTPLLFSVIAYIIWGGISTLYAASGKFAIFEFSKLLFALCVYLVVLFFTKPNEAGFRTAAYILAFTGAIFGIVSIDAASSGVLSGLFKTVFGIFTDVYADRGIFEEGIRITGIFGNPNIYAGFMAIAVLFSLYLSLHASNKKSAAISSALLAVNSLAYLLAFSLGSLFMFVIACLIMLGISEPGKRLNLFILMLETAVLAFSFSFLSMSGLGKTGAVSFIPLVVTVINAYLLYLSDGRLRPLLSSKLSDNKKWSLRIVALIIVLIALYIFAAFTISSDLVLSEGESAERAIYVPAGDYTLSVESSLPVSLTIESQNENDLIRHTSTRLFTGTNQQSIAFAVPDDSRIVMIQFTAGEDGVTLYSSQYSGIENGKLHLRYPLLPSIIANRLQNIFANENMVQRGIFFEDGMKLFSKSPIIGRGLGGFENGVYGVQDFYYETKYAHNHYIQALSDLGIVGLALFLCMLVSSAISIIRSKKRGQALFAVPVLAACLFQSFGQAATDATWSAGVFLGFAAAMLALITIFCSEPFKPKGALTMDRLRLVEKGALLVFSVMFILLLSGNLYAQAQAKAGVQSFDDIKRLAAVDRFEYNDYKVSYIINAPKSEDQDILAQADIYAQELMEEESNSIAPYVMIYNFETYKDYDAFEAAKQGIENAKSSPYMWSRVFDICEEYIDPVGPNTDDAADRLKSPKNYVDSVLELYDALLERNSSSLDQISLSQYNNTFIGKLLEIRATHLYSIDWVFTAIMTYAFDSECAADTDQNGIPDDISVLSGSMSRNEDGLLSVSDNTVLEMNLYHKLHGAYTFKVQTDTPLGISVSLNGENLAIVYDDDEAYAVIDMTDNSNKNLSKFTVTFPQAAVIDEITYRTKLE